jgi:hypothetical protein
MDMMQAAVEFVLNLVLAVFGGAFLLGLILNFLTGSGRALKYVLVGFALLFGVAAVVGLAVSGGLLIFLLFQLIILMLLFLFTLFVGGLCGSGLRGLLQRHGARKTLRPEQLGDYVEVALFCAAQGEDEERTLARIRSGYYQGGSCRGRWYVHKSEQGGADATPS